MLNIVECELHTEINSVVRASKAIYKIRDNLFDFFSFPRGSLFHCSVIGVLCDKYPTDLPINSNHFQKSTGIPYCVLSNRII